MYLSDIKFINLEASEWKTREQVNKIEGEKQSLVTALETWKQENSEENLRFKKQAEDLSGEIDSLSRKAKKAEGEDAEKLNEKIEKLSRLLKSAVRAMKAYTLKWEEFHTQLKFIEQELDKAKKKDRQARRDGVYDFDEKVEVDYRGTGKARESKWFFTWCRYDPRNNYQELREWKIMFGSSGFTPVNVDTDHYWPEPLAPDESGNYVFGDLILVKCRLIDYLKDKLERKKRARSNVGRAKLDKFQEQMEKHGASIPASMFDELMPTK